MLEQVIISVQIILIDIVMAADNAIIIGLIAAGFATENRRKIIAWGVAAAFLFRIIFASGANYLFEFAWIKILGGVLILFFPKKSCLKLLITHNSKTPPRILIQANSNK